MLIVFGAGITSPLVGVVLTIMIIVNFVVFVLGVQGPSNGHPNSAPQDAITDHQTKKIRELNTELHAHRLFTIQALDTLSKQLEDTASHCRRNPGLKVDGSLVSSWLDMVLTFEFVAHISLNNTELASCLHTGATRMDGICDQFLLTQIIVRKRELKYLAERMGVDRLDTCATLLGIDAYRLRVTARKLLERLSNN